LSWSKQDYLANDPRHNPDVDEANQKALTILGFTNIALRQVEDFKADYTATKAGKDVLVESQRLVFWQQGQFPYPSIGVFKRYTLKAHTQADVQGETPCYHLWLRNDLKVGYLASWSIIREKGEWETISTFRGVEEILETHLQHCHFIKVDLSYQQLSPSYMVDMEDEWF
jgi:hypothetical protein